MPQSYDTRKSPVVLDQDSTLIAVIEMSQESWLVAGIVPGIERQPLKKLAPDADALIRLLERWRAAGAKAGHAITRLVVAYETGCCRAGVEARPRRDRSPNPASCRAGR